MRTHSWLYVLGIVMLSGATACKLSSAEYATIDAWLLCDDCLNGEREAVRQIGGKAVHTLDRALIRPSPGRIANKQAQFQQMYRAAPPPAVSESVYVAGLLGNYIARYQLRAALALGDIGGRRALAALRRARNEAATREYRADVLSVIQAVIAFAEGDEFTGTVRPRRVRFADTVHVAEGAGPAWDGNESVVLHGSPFADSLVVDRWSSDSLAFLAVGAIGDYGLTVTGLGTSSGSQVSPLQIVPPGYETHDYFTPLLVTGLPQNRYLLLPSGVGDTTDFFRLQAPGTPLTVTATAVSTGRDSPRLLWLGCPPVPLGPPGGPIVTLTGYVVDPAGNPVGSANVEIPSLGFSVTSDATGRFRFTGLPPIALPPSLIALRASKTGYRLSSTSVLFRADSVRIPVVPAGATDATTLNRSSVTITIPAAGCRVLEVLVPAEGGPRIIKLAFTSP